MKKYLFIVAIAILLLANVAATPQVIFTSINLTISTGNFTIAGEGISATDVITTTGSCNYSYSRTAIPITFSREFTENNTDVATLIHALASNNNFTLKWEACVSKLQELDTNLTICSNDRGYKQNYTDCTKSLELVNIDLTSCNSQKNDYMTQVTTINKQLLDAKSNNTYYYILIAALAFGCYHFYNKNKIKTVNSPFSQLPSSARMS